jgi:hypothetical protein
MHVKMHFKMRIKCIFKLHFQLCGQVQNAAKKFLNKFLGLKMRSLAGTNIRKKTFYDFFLRFLWELVPVLKVKNTILNLQIFIIHL